MVLERLRERLQGIINKIAKFFDRVGLAPHHLGLLSILLAFLSSASFFLSNYSDNYVGLGILLFALAALMDAVDGALARFQGVVSKLGAFLDSFYDRVVEILIISSLMMGNLVGLVPGLSFLSTSLLISYARSRGEALGVDMAGIGWMERAERILFIIAGLVLWLINREALDMALVVGSALNTLTIAQRIHQVYKALYRKSE